MPSSSVLARLKSVQNMKPAEIADYLDSDEFAEHHGRGVEKNARRLLGLVKGKAGQLTHEDSTLVRQAIAVIERCKSGYGGPGGNDNVEEIAKAHAYGYDHDADKAEKGDKPAPTPAPTASDSTDDTGDEGPPPDEE